MSCIKCSACSEGIKEGPGFLRTVCPICDGLGFLPFNKKQLQELTAIATVQLAKEHNYDQAQA